MGYTNSSLVNCTVYSPNHSGRRTHAIDRITPHCVVGQATAEGIGGCFPAGREASCNYGIGYDGRVCLIVDEANRSWCSSSNENDQRAITIECASGNVHPYEFTTACYNKLIDLCVDVCRRNGKNKLIWFGDKNKTLGYQPKSNEMILTVHRWFANKSCPGDWMYARMGDLANKVTAKLQGTPVKPSTPAAPATPSKSLDEIARETIRGDWGNGDDRKARLERAGYNYNAVQAKVNEILSGNSNPITPSKSIHTIAMEVIRGDWGNGQDRINRLTAAGYNYNEVQREVNRLYG